MEEAGEEGKTMNKPWKGQQDGFMWEEMKNTEESSPVISFIMWDDNF